MIDYNPFDQHKNRDALHEGYVKPEPQPQRRMRHGERPTGTLEFKDIDQGGPAFPAIGNTGMSLRAYAAMEAPPAPEWFRHKDTRPIPHAPNPMALNAAHRDELACVNDGTIKAEHASPEVQTFIRHLRIYEGELNDWRAEQREAKFWNWRWYFADQIVKGARDA